MGCELEHLKSSLLEDDKTPIRSGNDGIEFQPTEIASMSFSLDQIKLIKTKLIGVVALPSLEVLGFYNLEFKRMWADQLPQTCYLKNLRELSIYWCSNLKYLLSSAFARNLVQLEKLEMFACWGMEEIIVIKEPTVTFDNYNELDIIDFPKLKETRLDVAFPNLEILVLEKLNAIKRIWPNQLPETSKLNNLVDLVVESCKGLKYVLPFAIAESLVRLKNLIVRKCVAVEEIIMIKEPKKEVEKIDEKPLANLKSLDLSDLPNLVRYCSIETNIIGGLIPEVHIRNCPKLWSRSAEKKEDKDMSLQEKINMWFPWDEEASLINYCP
ncbi:hypothetical protein FEM48_Zijuj04G0120400 [Ziziphus jujuba var. spinosa]|uniref:Disease resistance protein At4g27190-like leucine-rich repeats domain-containing protein n=1 Tax=Ziziphus jujuba var. spinosa TaxID=714518 RepID=A0A978VJS0_ZIZJJ|nr:hypothetical protein FEM48_Zijuj04G0120400 [Ziziphus jujuba var. spinosa]